MKSKKNIAVAILLCIYQSHFVQADYWSDRDALLSNESDQTTGSMIVLNEKELIVNKKLMELKHNEIDTGYNSPEKFLPSKHFFQSKKDIDKSEVFKFIQRLPKGASLHTHSSAMASIEYILNNITYRDHLYGCIKDSNIRMKFFYGELDTSCDWKAMSDLRAADSNFDKYLFSQLTIIVDDPANTYPDVNSVWTQFDSRFPLIGELLNSKTVFEDYIRQTYQEFYDDGVQYLEIRSGLSGTYDENGTYYGYVDIIDMYNTITKEFQAKNPDFLGVRIIFAKGRQITNDTLAGHLDRYLQLKSMFPESFAGFDLVGQEDLGYPLADFADQLVAVENLTNFYFHAGETNWFGTPSDQNLIDAVLLGAKRIGHGFAILKHPNVVRLVKEWDIAIELNPISNQVLGLVSDIRNHPGAALIAIDVPVVVTCDDPTFWGAKGLSYDWYMTFLGLTSRDIDLRFLKQLAINSIKYSSLESDAAADFLVKWSGKWDQFIDEYLNEINNL